MNFKLNHDKCFATNYIGRTAVYVNQHGSFLHFLSTDLLEQILSTKTGKSGFSLLLSEPYFNEDESKDRNFEILSLRDDGMGDEPHDSTSDANHER